MAETPSKRQREQGHVVENYHVEESKRHKSYNHILSILEEEEEEESTQDLSSLITTLQQELSSGSTFDSLSYPSFETDAETLTIITSTTTEDYPSSSSSSSLSSFLKEDEQDERERVMRHLLEASDDELGIPNREETLEFLNNGSDASSAVECFSLSDGLWEFEDTNANYYDLVQSELFMPNTC